MTTEELRDFILATVDDAVTDLVYYNHINKAPSLPWAVAAGVITIDEVVNHFRDKLRAALL